MRRSDTLAALVATLFVVGPLAHLAWHDDGHRHLPGGGVVVQGLVSERGHPHSHDAGHAHHDADHAHHDTDDSDHSHHSDGSEGPSHGAGSLAHLGGAPPLTAPVLTPPPVVRVLRRPVIGVEHTPIAWGGRVSSHAWRSRGPPVRT